MVTSATRRQAPFDAISKVVAGLRPPAAEMDLVDSKLEEGPRDRPGTLLSIGPRHGLAALLARKTACSPMPPGEAA